MKATLHRGRQCVFFINEFPLSKVTWVATIEFIGDFMQRKDATSTQLGFVEDETSGADDLAVLAHGAADARVGCVDGQWVQELGDGRCDEHADDDAVASFELGVRRYSIGGAQAGRPADGDAHDGGEIDAGFFRETNDGVGRWDVYDQTAILGKDRYGVRCAVQ
jgi:hypothetical protein